MFRVRGFRGSGFQVSGLQGFRVFASGHEGGVGFGRPVAYGSKEGILTPLLNDGGGTGKPYTLNPKP